MPHYLIKTVALWIALMTLSWAGGLLAATPSPGTDTIRLDNGRSIRGVIEEETDRHVAIRVGDGRMHFDRSRIVSIDYGDPEAREQQLREWQAEHSLRPSALPEDLRSLAADFRRLSDTRRQLGQVAAERRRLAAREKQLMQALDRHHREAVTLNRRLADSDPREDPLSYNRRVAAANALNATLHATHRDLEQTRRSMAEPQSSMDDYVRDLDAVHQRYREKRQKVCSDNENYRRFLDGLASRLSRLRQELHEVVIETEPRGSVSVVTARINGFVDGRFIVDTGAGVVTISADFAKRLGVPPAAPDARTTQVVLADGRHVEARPVLLESVHVGGHTEHHVAAVILDKAPADHIDGLLGMSFLNRFNVFLDGSGRLVLRRLDAF